MGRQDADLGDTAVPAPPLGLTPEKVRLPAHPFHKYLLSLSPHEPGMNLSRPRELLRGRGWAASSQRCQEGSQAHQERGDTERRLRGRQRLCKGDPEMQSLAAPHRPQGQSLKGHLPHTHTHTHTHTHSAPPGSKYLHQADTPQSKSPTVPPHPS